MTSEDKIKELFEASKELKKPGDYFKIVLEDLVYNWPTTPTVVSPEAIVSSSTITVQKAMPETFISDGTGDVHDLAHWKFHLEKSPLFDIGPIEFPEGSSEEDNPFAPWDDFTSVQVTTTYLKLCSPFEVIINIKDIFAMRNDPPKDKKKLLLEVIEELKLMAKEIQTDETEDEDILL